MSIVGDALIESVDGPVAIGGLVGKSIPVLTRVPERQLGFRLILKIAVVASAVPVVRVGFDNGQSVVVARDHVFYAPNGAERPAADLAIDETLDTSYHFPAGYVFSCKDGTTEVSVGALRVRGIEDVGIADVFTGVVNQTGCYFVTAGVLSKA
jgi:hypothetical protein